MPGGSFKGAFNLVLKGHGVSRATKDRNELAGFRR